MSTVTTSACAASGASTPAESASSETQRETNEMREADIVRRFSNLARHFNGWPRGTDDAKSKRKAK
ncbi:hypothetical protein, partial [Ralstonia pseudosolanacearum]|uniref:hypothetical protein n=1 Tax=Ralstonia pseudosolanacearum TaxID=1310165 RepID=UPI003CF9EDBC